MALSFSPQRKAHPLSLPVFEAPVDSVNRGFFFGLSGKENDMAQRLLHAAIGAGIYLLVAAAYVIALAGVI
jgi:hypothetical protein